MDPLDILPRTFTLSMNEALSTCRGQPGAFRAVGIKCRGSSSVHAALDVLHGSARSCTDFVKAIIQELGDYMQGPVGEPAHMTQLHELMRVCDEPSAS